MAPMGSIARAWLRIGGVAAAALAAALFLAEAVERTHPELTRLPEAAFHAFGVPRIDFDQRLTPAVVDYAVRLSRRFGIGALVNLGGGSSGDGLEAQLDAAARHGGRVKVFMNLDPSGCCGGDWVVRETARLDRGRSAGAAGLAILSAGEAAAGPEPLPDALWLACERLGLPVALQRGAAELAERHPRLAVVALGLGGLADDPEAASAALSRLPNLWLELELGRTAQELARRGEAARALVLAHPGRILFGTGIRYEDRPPYHELFLGEGPPVEDEAGLRRFFLGLYRFLETRDPEIPGLAAGQPPLPGLGLPRPALERIYHRNGRRLLALSPEGP